VRIPNIKPRTTRAVILAALVLLTLGGATAVVPASAQSGHLTAALSVAVPKRFAGAEASRSLPRTWCGEEICPPKGGGTVAVTVRSDSLRHTLQPKKPVATTKPSPSVSAGGGSGCAPKVTLPSNVVTIVHKYLSGCAAADLLWIIRQESGGNVHATNPSSGAYGIPQALPGSKMATAGANWRDNADTQIRWMISYVKRYGGPIGAYRFWVMHHWY